MRAKEFLSEDYNSDLNADLNNLLIGAKGTGSQKINTMQLTAQLQAMGYAVDETSIINLLQQNPIVSQATDQEVVLNQPNAGGGAGNTQDSASKVNTMAQKATKIG